MYSSKSSTDPAKSELHGATTQMAQRGTEAQLNQDDRHGDGFEPMQEEVPEKKQRESWMGHYMEDLTKEDAPLDAAPRLLPWRVGLFLLTSTITQNLSYLMATYARTNMYVTWTAKQRTQFSSLVYPMLYLGPVFGFVVDLVRIFGERFRPVIIIACIINAVVGFVFFATKQVPQQYGSCLMLTWMMEVLVMFIYIPMNAVVINYGNRLLESPTETSSRVGGLMAQAMVWRTAGTLIYNIFYQFAYGSYSHPYVSFRWFCLIAAIASLVLVVQVLFLMKRAYFTDFRKASLKTTEQVRFCRNMMTPGKAKNGEVVAEAPGGKFMFILCFTFIYFMLPDPLYNTKYSFESPYTASFSLHLNQAVSILGSIGAVLGALAYALWMFFDQLCESRRSRLFRTTPFVIVLAGCAVWTFGIFFHFIGEWGSTHAKFNWHVYIAFEAVVYAACLRFAFMPSLSLAAMHAPRFFEASAFQLYSLATSGGGVVASPITSALMRSLGVTVRSGYWKAMLLFLFFRMFPMIIGVTLPMYREDETIPVQGRSNEPVNEVEWAEEPVDVRTPHADSHSFREL